MYTLTYLEGDKSKTHEFANLHQISEWFHNQHWYGRTFDNIEITHCGS